MARPRSFEHMDRSDLHLYMPRKTLEQLKELARGRGITPSKLLHELVVKELNHQGEKQ